MPSLSWILAFPWDHRKVDALRGDEEHQGADININAVFESVDEWGSSAGTVADRDVTAVLRKGRVCLELTAHWRLVAGCWYKEV